jgi:hypothetical protein
LKLLKFTDFITEAAKTPHAVTREAQRFGESMQVSIPKKMSDLIKAADFKTGQIYSKLRQFIREAFAQKLKDAEAIEFDQGHFVLVLCEPTLYFNNTTVPITMNVKSDKEAGDRIVIKEYTGTRICAYVTDNEIKTFKVVPVEWTSEEIAQDAQEALENSEARRERDFTKKGIPFRKSPTKIRQVIPLNPYLRIKIDSEGEAIIPDETIVGAPRRDRAEREYALKPGRKIKVNVPFLGGMTEVEIDKVINQQTARQDKAVKIDVTLPDGRKLPKTLKPGDPVELPTEEGWEAYKVTDNLFVEYPKERGGYFSIKVQ